MNGVATNTGQGPDTKQTETQEVELKRERSLSRRIIILLIIASLLLIGQSLYNLFNLQQVDQEKSVLKWGGLAGILGGILFVLGWVIVIVGPVGMEDPADLAGWVARFPDIQAARVVENLEYLAALLLAVLFYLALYRALRKTRLAPALFGCALGILGLVSMAVGATPHVAHAPLSEL